MLHSSIQQCVLRKKKQWTKVRAGVRSCHLAASFYQRAIGIHSFLTDQDKITERPQHQTLGQNFWQVPGECVGLVADVRVCETVLTAFVMPLTSASEQAFFISLATPSSCSSTRTVLLHPREARGPVLLRNFRSKSGFAPSWQQDDLLLY